MIWKRQELVNAECDKWARKGINIMSEIRDNRIGYKAGALKAGMMHNYVKQCEFVAIFDADFQPDPDFLARTIPFLTHNREISLVQCRWKFGKIIIINIWKFNGYVLDLKQRGNELHFVYM